jgi:adenosylcobinamide-phosphate synthase
MSVALLSVAAVALDALLGEPKRWHPLVAFGRFAETHRATFQWRWSRLAQPWRHRVGDRGLPLTLLATALSWAPYVGWVVEILALYCALGMRSLGEHVEPVAKALRSDDLEEARKRVGYLVSRKTTNWTKPKSPVPPPNRCWKTAATQCSPRCSGLPWPVRRAWCSTV